MLKISFALLLLFSSSSYQVDGQVVSPSRYRRGTATLHAMDGTKVKDTYVGHDGKFRFKNVPEGNYHVIITMDRARDVRRSLEVRAGFADENRRIPLRIDVAEAIRDRQQHEISVTKLSVPSEARREFRRAAQSAPDLERARQHLERAIEIAPHYDEALNNLGTIYIRQGRRDEAIALFERAVAANPVSFFGHVNLGGALIWKHEFERALEQNLKAMALRPEDGLSRAQAGIALYFMRRHAEAMPYLNEARRLDPHNAIAPGLYLARIHEAMGETQTAIQEYDQFLKNHPAHPLTQFARSRVRLLAHQ